MNICYTVRDYTTVQDAIKDAHTWRDLSMLDTPKIQKWYRTYTDLDLDDFDFDDVDIVDQHMMYDTIEVINDFLEWLPGLYSVDYNERREKYEVSIFHISRILDRIGFESIMEHFS